MKIINLEKGRKMRKNKTGETDIESTKESTMLEGRANPVISLVAQLVENLPAIWVDLGSISGLG